MASDEERGAGGGRLPGSRKASNAEREWEEKDAQADAREIS